MRPDKCPVRFCSPFTLHIPDVRADINQFLCECVNICYSITTQCPKAQKKKGERAVCIKPVCAQICQLSCWCRGSGIIPSPRPGSEDWSMHFLSLLSVTRPVKGFMARICTQTYTHQYIPSGRTNTYAKGPLLKLFSCNPLPRPSKRTHTYPKAINKAITHIVYMLGTRKVLQANFPKDVQTFRGSFTIFPTNSTSHRGDGSITRKGTEKWGINI